MLGSEILEVGASERIACAAREGRGMPVQAPIALSLIVCDTASVDRGTGKTSLLGCFESVFSTTFPCAHPELTVFAELTDGRGQTPVTCRFARTLPDNLDGETLHSASIEVPFTDPLQIFKLVLTMRMLPFPMEGEYRVILEAEGTYIIERRIVAKKTS